MLMMLGGRNWPLNSSLRVRAKLTTISLTAAALGSTSARAQLPSRHLYLSQSETEYSRW